MKVNYKYDIISTKVFKNDNSKKYLLGDNLKTSEVLLAKFNDYINKMSGIYAASTNIEKGEFFGEAVLALGKATIEFDTTKSMKFTPFAKFLILDAMNECAKANKTLLHIPSYIHKAHSILNRIESNISGYTKDLDTVLFDPIFRQVELPTEINKIVNNDITLLTRAAKRASITLKQLVERALVLPMISTYEINNSYIEEDTNQDTLIAKIIVEKIKLLLNEDELAVATLIMQDESKKSMCIILNRSIHWINNRIVSIRKKVKRMIMGEKGIN